MRSTSSNDLLLKGKWSSEARDLKFHCNHLASEIQRKDLKIESLGKDLQILKNGLASAQKDMRNLSVVHERMKTENLNLQKELIRVKELNDALTLRMSSLGDEQQLHNQIENGKYQMEKFLSEIKRLSNEILERDSKVNSLQRELEVLHRTMSIQGRYDVLNKENSSRELIRTLYYDIGKKDTEIHNLALTLAASHKDVTKAEQDLEDFKVRYDAMEGICGELRKEVNEWKSKYLQLETEKLTTHEHMKNDKEMIKSQEQQLQELTSQLIDVQRSHIDVINEKNHKIQELSIQLSECQAKLHHEHAVNEKLQLDLTELECKRSEQEIESNDQLRTLHMENRQLMEENKIIEHLHAQLNSLSNNLYDALKFKENAEIHIQTLNNRLLQVDTKIIPDFHAIIENMKLQHTEVENKLKASQAQEKQLYNERNEAVEALRQTIIATRDVTHKYQKERDYRVTAERQLDTLRKQKENISESVLDSLQKEREKNARLEAILESLPDEYRNQAFIRNVTKENPVFASATSPYYTNLRDLSPAAGGAMGGSGGIGGAGSGFSVPSTANPTPNRLSVNNSFDFTRSQIALSAIAASAAGGGGGDVNRASLESVNSRGSQQHQASSLDVSGGGHYVRAESAYSSLREGNIAATAVPPPPAPPLPPRHASPTRIQQQPATAASGAGVGANALRESYSPDRNSVKLSNLVELSQTSAYGDQVINRSTNSHSSHSGSQNVASGSNNNSGNSGNNSSSLTGSSAKELQSVSHLSMGERHASATLLELKRLKSELRMLQTEN